MFSPIHLEEMESVKLMNRIDTKYITKRENIILLLSKMINDYLVQEIDGRRISSYHTLYMDTPDAAMYTAHQNDRKTRQKIRIREYVDSHLFFFEIKNKNNKGRTKKKRISLSDMNVYQNEEIARFMEGKTPYKMENLIPQLNNYFDRITLVNKEKTERMTIDLNLRFHNMQTKQDDHLEKIAIIELKQDGNTVSKAKQLLNDLRIHPQKISKYCTGSALTNPRLKTNRFKIKMRYINKLINQ